MALNGLQIQKLLPKTNCKECGANTCLAFAMKLAAKKAELSECPYASEEAIAVLGADNEPPVKQLTLGSDINTKIGGETVLYRHEKTFINDTMLAINIDDDAGDAQETLNKIKDYQLERVGEILILNAVAITQKSGDAAKFAALAKKAFEITKLPLILRSDDTKAIKEAAAAVSGTNSVIAGVNKDNVDELLACAKEHSMILSIAGELDEITAITRKLKADGFNNMVMQFEADSLAATFQLNSIARIAAIKDNVKELGYATLKFVDTGDELTDTVMAINEIEKFGGVCVLPKFDAAQLVNLMTLRLNIYTDPQKPIQMEPKIYPIGEPDRNSMVFVTTNFSLTYFIVSGEIENSGISAWLVVPECEGFSVLTAWSAGKFSGTSIAKFIKEADLESMVDTRTISIPGYVAQISGELEEALPGWKVAVAPQEAADIESYIKAFNR
ncbi:MAG: acetyl-CoA decarbonylase/synthase complex subunit gamma [Clostridia bacterium]|jgi:acetyl-CoA decarbonylase/synthase, CODH/ACS complex subunit gamma|nr:acetyl-CoA decarbonylase/synthase complex subunit gamma [Clostridia bacterium]MBT7122290.1 acetyl-CoA decarbonylase/synthase complex subunit gamma [Clostridia bacterium]